MAELTYNGKDLREKYPEGFKKLCEAMTKSKGKVDNIVGETLVKSTTATVEDIVRIAGGYVESEQKEDSCWNRNKHSNVVWNRNEPRTKEQILETRKSLRKEHAQECRKYEFNDSYLYRAMIKFGMTPKSDGEGTRVNWYCRRNYRTDKPEKGHMVHNTQYAMVTAMYLKAGEDLRNKIISNEDLNELWTDQAQIRRRVDSIYSDKEKELHPISFTDEEWRKFQIEHIIKEFGWLANAPQNVLDDLHGWIEHMKDKTTRYNQTKMPFTITNVILNAFRYPSEDKSVALVEESYRVMEYMGIGVCWNYISGKNLDENGNVTDISYRDSYSNQASVKVGAMLKKVSSMMRRFAADVKKGFDPKDVRELVVDDLNGWAQAQVEGRWQFYVREDAPESYEDLQPKKKGSKNTEKVKLYNKSLELDENCAEDAGFFEVMDKLNLRKENDTNERE